MNLQLVLISCCFLMLSGAASTEASETKAVGHTETSKAATNEKTETAFQSTKAATQSTENGVKSTSIVETSSNKPATTSSEKHTIETSSSLFANTVQSTNTVKPSSSAQPTNTVKPSSSAQPTSTVKPTSTTQLTNTAQSSKVEQTTAQSSKVEQTTTQSSKIEPSTTQSSKVEPSTTQSSKVFQNTVESSTSKPSSTQPTSSTLSTSQSNAVTNPTSTSQYSSTSAQSSQSAPTTSTGQSQSTQWPNQQSTTSFNGESSNTFNPSSTGFSSSTGIAQSLSLSSGLGFPGKVTSAIGNLFGKSSLTISQPTNWPGFSSSTTQTPSSSWNDFFKGSSTGSSTGLSTGSSTGLSTGSSTGLSTGSSTGLSTGSSTGSSSTEQPNPFFNPSGTSFTNWNGQPTSSNAWNGQPTSSNAWNGQPTSSNAWNGQPTSSNAFWNGQPTSSNAFWNDKSSTQGWSSDKPLFSDPFGPTQSYDSVISSQTGNQPPFPDQNSKWTGWPDWNKHTSFHEMPSVSHDVFPTSGPENGFPTFHSEPSHSEPFHSEPFHSEPLPTFHSDNHFTNEHSEQIPSVNSNIPSPTSWTPTIPTSEHLPSIHSEPPFSVNAPGVSDKPAASTSSSASENIWTGVTSETAISSVKSDAVSETVKPAIHETYSSAAQAVSSVASHSVQSLQSAVSSVQSVGQSIDSIQNGATSSHFGNSIQNGATSSHFGNSIQNGATSSHFGNSIQTTNSAQPTPSSIVIFSPSSGSYVASTVAASALSASHEASEASQVSGTNIHQSTVASATSNWVPSTLQTATLSQLASATSATSETAVKASSSSAKASATSSAPELPNAITPATETPLKQNYTIITIGFKAGLNYPFVVDHTLASAQVFQYLPKTLTYIFDHDDDAVAVKQLVPFQSSSLDYIVTVAEVYFPKDWVSALNESIQTSYSNFYFNTDPTENALAQLVDTNIPLVGLESGAAVATAPNPTNSPAANAAQTPVAQGLANPSFGSVDSQPTQKSTNPKLKYVGTFSGVSATVYISVLLVGFRYYKQKKGLHFASDKNGNILLPIAERGTIASEKEHVPQVLLNPEYQDPALQRRMSYQSMNSFAIGMDDQNSPDFDMFSVNQVDSMDDTLEQVESIIPTMSNPTSVRDWF